MTAYRVLVTGSRDWADEAPILHAMTEARISAVKDPQEMVLVSGACPTGADRIAEELAAALGWAIERHPADWNQFGKAAGPIRNNEMVKAGADICLAFMNPGSRGTLHCSQVAIRAGIPTEIVHGERVPKW